MARKRAPGPKPAQPAKKTTNLLPKGFTFEHLVKAIHAVHSEAAVQASRRSTSASPCATGSSAAISPSTNSGATTAPPTAKNCSTRLAAELTRLAVSNTNRRQLYRYLRFYRTYPGIVGALSPQFRDPPPRRRFGPLAESGDAVPTIAPFGRDPAQPALLQPPGTDCRPGRRAQAGFLRPRSRSGGTGRYANSGGRSPASTTNAPPCPTTRRSWRSWPRPRPRAPPRR